MPKAKSSRHLSAGATAAVSSHAHKLWDKLEALTAPVEPSLSEAQPKVVSFSLDQPTPELPMATSDQESWAMQNEADSNVLHAWLVAAQSQVAVLSRHRLQEHASRTEAERHKQNADELERRHLGLLREHARLAHQMRTQLEAAERRALDAEESAGRMDEERHQWRARVSVLEEKVAGLTSALGEARDKIRELARDKVREQRGEDKSKASPRLPQPAQGGGFIPQVAPARRGKASTGGGASEEAAVAAAAAAAAVTELSVNLRVPVLDGEGCSELVIALRVPLKVDESSMKSVMTELITEYSEVDAGVAEEEATERTMEEEASEIASAIAPRAKRPTREEVAAAKAAEARRAAETKAAAKEAAARRAAIIERAEAEAAKLKAANMAANKAVGTDAKAKSGGKVAVVGGGVGPGAAASSSVRVPSKGSPSQNVKPKR